jgi:hypothetical protein
MITLMSLLSFFCDSTGFVKFSGGKNDFKDCDLWGEVPNEKPIFEDILSNKINTM